MSTQPGLHWLGFLIPGRDVGATFVRRWASKGLPPGVAEFSRVDRAEPIWRSWRQGEAQS